MKRIFLIFLALMLLASCAKQKNENTPIIKNTSPAQVKKTADNPAMPVLKLDNKVKAVNIDSQEVSDIDELKKLGFNLVFLSVNGVRIPKAPYKTDNAALRTLEGSIRTLETNRMDYIIDIKSGPGFSIDGKISTIFSNDTEALYFAKMAGEIIKRHKTSKSFRGISITLENPIVDDGNYYKTMKYIILKIQNVYPDVNVVLNLSPSSFEDGFKDIPEFNLDNISLNAGIYLKGMSYPGYGAGYKTSLKLNKNVILSNLQTLKEIQDKTKKKVFVTVKVPWTDSSDVFLQDLYEIMKMLKFDLNIYRGSSSSDYDFTQNQDIIKVIKRNNQ